MKLRRDTIRRWLVTAVARLTGLHPDAVDAREAFSAFGLSSVQLVTLAREIEERFEKKVPATIAYEYPTIDKIASFLIEDRLDHAPVIPALDLEPIALVGLACRFPSAPSVDE